MGKHEQVSGAERVAKRRAALRARGLRPRQFWLPDMRDATVRNEIAAQARRIAANPGFAEDLAFVEAMRFWPADRAD